tara:strand:+ start:203082 stop:206588 length:3507 start_codon:yes stop_codon:yes gene_type:complete
VSGKIKILNLCQELPESLSEIFAKIGAETSLRSEAVDYDQLDFIVVDSEEEALLAEKDYDVINNEITIVCLGQVKEMKTFMLGNGRFAFDPLFASTDLGKAALTKFFTNECNIHLDEAYSGIFKQTENFKVTNHLAIGSSVDELSLKAFESGFNIVSLRSFLDHILMYFTYLKQAGLAGVPYEVEYAHNGDYFAVNVHASVKNFVADYMVDSFGAVNSSDPLRYLLAVSSRSADFMDVTFLENPGKVVINGFWSSKLNGKFNGISFNNIKTASSIMASLDRKVGEYESADKAEHAAVSKSEKLANQYLPGGILEMVVDGVDPESALAKQPEDTSKLIAFAIGHFEEVYPDSILSEMTEEDLGKVLSDYPGEEFVQRLSDGDKEALLEKIQKKNITDAYEEELERVRGNLEDEEEFKKDLSDTLSEEVVNRVSSQIDADVINRVLGNAEEENQNSQIIPGGEGTDRFSQTISGKEEEDQFKASIVGLKETGTENLAQRISGEAQKKLGQFNVKSGSSEDEEKGAFKFVSLALNGLDSLDIDPKAKKFLRSKAPKKIGMELKDYATGLGLKLSELESEHLSDFFNNNVKAAVEGLLSDKNEIDEFIEEARDPLIVERKKSVLQNASPEFREKFKTKFEQKIKDSKELNLSPDALLFSPDDVAQDGFQEIVKESMRETLNEQFRFEKANRDEIENKEKEIIEALSKTLSKDEGEVKVLVKGATEKVKEKETKKVVENLFSEAPGESKNTSFEDTKLMDRLKSVEDENKKLMASNKSLAVKVKALESGDKITSAIEAEAKEEAAIEVQAETDDEKVFGVEIKAENVDLQAIEDLKNGRTLSPESIQSIARMVQREQEVLNNAKLAEENFKKAEIEHGKRESKYKSAIHEANKESKAKDVAIVRIKESVKSLVEKKQAEINAFKAQVETLNHRLAGDQTAKLQGELKKIKKEFESAKKTVSVYKGKLNNLVKSKEKTKAKDNSAELMAENRNLSRLKNQLENKLTSAEKHKNAVEAQFGKLKDQEKKLRERASAAEKKTKEANEEIRKLKENEARLVAMAEKGKGTEPKPNNEVETLKSKNAQLEKSVKELTKKMASQGAKKSGSKDEKSANENRLEQSVKKLNSEFAKAQKELGEQKKQVVKYKSEITGLKNKIKALEKEVASKKGRSKKAA